MAIDREAGELELGYIVAPGARGRGVAGEILRRRVAERGGYVLEGVLRSLFIKPGIRRDTQLWSRLRSDDGRP